MYLEFYLLIIPLNFSWIGQLYTYQVYKNVDTLKIDQQFVKELDFTPLFIESDVVDKTANKHSASVPLYKDIAEQESTYLKL